MTAYSNKASLRSLSVVRKCEYRTSIYFWYVYVEDLNTIFYGDGEDSPNYIIVLLLSWVTCGIYGVFWRYKQANRMYRESYDRYGDD